MSRTGQNSDGEPIWPLQFPAELRDGDVSLRLYDEQAVDELFAALDDVLAWEHIPHSVPTSAQAFDQRIQARLADGYRVTLTVLQRGRVVGMTSILFDPTDPEGVEIGGTQLAPQTWGTGVNTRAKALLIDRIFEQGATWIQFRTDERNARSAAAIRKLGAADLGVHQDHRVRRDGSLRSSRMFRLAAPSG